MSFFTRHINYIKKSKIKYKISYHIKTNTCTTSNQIENIYYSTYAELQPYIGHKMTPCPVGLSIPVYEEAPDDQGHVVSLFSIGAHVFIYLWKQEMEGFLAE